jgi:hypothetical protein
LEALRGIAEPLEVRTRKAGAPSKNVPLLAFPHAINSLQKFGWTERLRQVVTLLQFKYLHLVGITSHDHVVAICVVSILKAV